MEVVTIKMVVHGGLITMLSKSKKMGLEESATVDVVEPPVSQSSSPESLVTASAAASAMLI